MKLVIGDTKKLYTFQLPKNPEEYYIINFKYYADNSSFNETLTLKYFNKKWSITADDKLEIRSNNTKINNVVLEENRFFELKFANMSDFFNVYVFPDLCDFKAYSIYNSELFKVGSSSDCEIHADNLINNVAQFVHVGMDYYVERLDNNKNTCFVNGLAFSRKKLVIGDCIFLNGIKVIYMKGFILVYLPNANMKVQDLPALQIRNSGIESPITPVNDIEKNIKLYDDNDIFTHSPRLKNEIENVRFTFDNPPAKNSSQKTPVVLTMGASVLMTLSSSMSMINSVNDFMRSENKDYLKFMTEVVVFAVMIITSLLLPFINNKWDRHVDKKNEKKRQEKYKKYLEGKIAEINQYKEKQESILKKNNITLDAIVDNIKNDCINVWDREIGDNDFLEIVLGNGDLPAAIEIDEYKKSFSMEEDNLIDLLAEATANIPKLNDVPVTFSLLNNVVTPIVINSQFRDDYINSLFLQILYHHCGRDLKIFIITDEYNSEKWNYLKHLAHCWDKNYENRFFSSSNEDIYQLSSILDQKFEERSSSGESDKDTGKAHMDYTGYDEYYLIITDNYNLVRDLPAISKISESKINYGFSLLILEDSVKELPTKFKSLVTIDDNGGRIINKNDANNSQIEFTPAYIKELDIEKYTRAIANIPVVIKSESADIPGSLNFLEMFHAGRVEQLNVLSRWQKNNPTLSLKTPLGFKGNEVPVELDLHEKFHGPHGLIAGTTGSGKSEFIITYILSLAVNYHPYEVQFILIDYKGGGLAGAFENRETGLKLPHLVGTITNLDKAEMDRTLVSIKSELQRRQRVFNETREALDEGTIDIYKYQRLYREGKIKNPMAHLFIIADEFAELKAQQPEFMDELVSAARIGRSLGVHLILATQKPSGVVDDQIWSNTRFRICLKVQTTGDSQEMLKNSDAAYIKQSGRFYLQVGNDEIYELGQSGWAGAKYIPSDNAKIKVNDNILVVNNYGEVLKTVNEEVKKDDSRDFGEQLTNIVKYMYNLAKKENIVTSKLWLDNVPETIYYDNLIKKYDVKSTPYVLEATIGEYDDPSNQKQGLVTFPIQKCGNTYIYGMSGSGKTTLLINIIYSLIINHNSNELNFYIIDFGTEKLRKFAKAPQVGEFLTINDAEKIKFLFYMLKDERDIRFNYYVENGGSFDNDLKNGKCSFPSIIVIINDFDVFKESFEDIYDNEFSSFTRNCTKVGIYFIITASSGGALNYMIENNFPKKIVLNLLDPIEYKDAFEDAPTPKKNPGRGIIELDSVYEFQVPLIFEDNIFDNYMNRIINLLNKYLPERAKSVPTIPEEVDINTLLPRVRSIKDIPVGINIKTALIETFNLDFLLNVMVAASNVTIKKFLPIFINVISKLQNTKIMVINSMADLDFKFDESIKYYNGDYSKIINVINKNIEKYKENLSDDKFIIFFIGFGKLQKELEKQQKEDETIITIEDLIYNSRDIKNFNYVIYDSERAINLLGDGKIDSFFKRSRGIWLGKEFDSQSVFEVTNQYTEMVITNSNIVKVENNNANYIKFN